MDSLSYVFLAYASYTLALAALTPGGWEGKKFFLRGKAAVQGSWRPLVLGAVLMVTLETTPWPSGATAGFGRSTAIRRVLLGIPLSNFGGWFLVALVLIRVLQLFWPGARPRRAGSGPAHFFPGQPCWQLYLGILGFNLTMTFLIGEACLGWVGIFIYTPFLAWLALKPGGHQERP